MTKSAKFSNYYFYLNVNLWVDFQLCISVPLSFLRLILNELNGGQSNLNKRPPL